MGFDYKELRKKKKQKKVFPFYSDRKKMCTIYEDDTGRNYAFVKGDPDFLLPYCTKYINKYGRVSKIDSAFSNHINSVILDFAHHSL